MMTSWRSPSAYDLPRDHRHQPEDGSTSPFNRSIHSKLTMCKNNCTWFNSCFASAGMKSGLRLTSPPFSFASLTLQHTELKSPWPADRSITQRLSSSPQSAPPVVEVGQPDLCRVPQPDSASLTSPEARLTGGAPGVLTCRLLRCCGIGARMSYGTAPRG